MEKLYNYLILFLVSSIACNNMAAQDRLFSTFHPADYALSTRQIFTQNGEYDFNDTTPICGLSVDGTILQKSHKGFVRVLMVDTQGNKYLVLEANRQRNMNDTIVLNQYCEETADMNQIVPARLEVYVRDAELNLRQIHCVSAESVKNSPMRANSNEIKRQQVEAHAQRINNYNQQHEIAWMAGVTKLALSDYSVRKNVLGFGDSTSTGGLEFYVGGIFEVGEDDEIVPLRATAPFTCVDNFDWRNRHGTNWITSVKNQGESGYCVAFAIASMLEARTNLYFNRKLDLNLSEQDIVYNYARQGHNAINLIYSTGMNPSVAMQDVVQLGVIDEASEPFVDDTMFVVPPRPTGNECISISSANSLYPNSDGSNIEQIKQLLIQNGPLVSGIQNCGGNHAMCLVGYHTIQEGDTIHQVKVLAEGGLFAPVIVSSDSYSHLKGETYWVFKDNYGIEPVDKINGYLYVWFKTYNCMRAVDYTTSSILSQNYTTDSIAVTDADGDGYYFWGIGDKPAHCPSWVPTDPDGDDSDYDKGPMNALGFLQETADLLNDTIFINSNTTWSQPRFLYSHVVVQNNAMLTINEDVTFYKNVELILRGDSKLHIDGCTLQNADVKIEQNSASRVVLSNGGKQNRRAGKKFSVPLWATLQMTNGKIQ